MEKKQTGYPHIDKPWMKWYGEDVEQKYKNIVYPSTNMVEYLRDVNKNNMNDVAEQYYFANTTYAQMFENSNTAAKVLSEIGVKRGQSLLVLTPNIPEAGYIWFGATQIGGIADFADPRPDGMDLRASALKELELIKYENPKYIVAFDMCYLAMIKPIENELKELGINDIILLNATDSMTLKGKIEYLKDILNYDKISKGEDITFSLDKTDLSIANLKRYKKELDNMIKKQHEINKQLEEAIRTSPLRVMKYSDLIRECKNSRFEKVIDPEAVNYIGHTSGTSGSRPKPIPHTNIGAISSVIQLQDAGVGPEKGNTSLHSLPFFAPFGAYNNFLQVYANGGVNIHIPEFVMSEFGYLIPRYKPNTIMGPPSFYESMTNSKYLEGQDMSYLKEIIYGGDSKTAKQEELENKFFQMHNSPAIEKKGHGLSETQGCAAYANGDYNVPESIGIPLPGTTYAIIDPDIDDALVPLKFEDGQDILIGELAICGPHVTPGIVDGKTITKHDTLDGMDVIRTRDLIWMNRDGICGVLERKDRSFARIDGFKIQPYVIENEIIQNKNISKAVVVPYYDEKFKSNMPICHIELVDDAKDKADEEIVTEIVYGIIDNPNMVSRQIPTKFKIHEKLPLNKGGKVDFASLQKDGIIGDEVNVDISETNVAISGIKIYKNTKQKVRKI